MTLGTNNPYYDEPFALQKLKKGPLSPYLDGFAMRLSEIKVITMKRCGRYFIEVGSYLRMLILPTARMPLENLLPMKAYTKAVT